MWVFKEEKGEGLGVRGGGRAGCKKVLHYRWHHTDVWLSIAFILI